MFQTTNQLYIYHDYLKYHQVFHYHLKNWKKHVEPVGKII